MTQHNRIGGYFIQETDSTLKFESANALKSSVMMMFYVLLGAEVLAEIGSVLRGFPSLYHELAHGEDRIQYLYLLVPFILPIIWLFLPSVRVTLDRNLGKVVFKKGKQSFEFPWRQINFNHQWFPTKTGSACLFTMFALPPFPFELVREIEKKGPASLGQIPMFKLGSFDVKGPEHGQAIFAFLDAWMHSQEPAEILYITMVITPFGE